MTNYKSHWALFANIKVDFKGAQLLLPDLKFLNLAAFVHSLVSIDLSMSTSTQQS